MDAPENRGGRKGIKKTYPGSGVILCLSTKAAYHEKQDRYFSYAHKSGEVFDTSRTQYSNYPRLFVQKKTYYQTDVSLWMLFHANKLINSYTLEIWISSAKTRLLIL